MRILQWYISKIVFQHIMVTIVILLALFTFVTFIDELGNLNKGQYGLVQIIQYVLLSIPKILYEMFPMAALIGTIMGMSVLAKDSELIVMRASGVSIFQIVGIVIKMGLVLVFFSVILGEVISPYTETKAQKVREESLQNNVIQRENNLGLWLRDGDSYVNIREILPDLSLREVTVFEFDKKNALRVLSNAKKGHFIVQEKQTGYWVLEGLKRTTINKQSSSSSMMKEAHWETSVNPNILKVFMIQADQLSVWQLHKYIQHLRVNKQQTNHYELAFWTKIMTPFATMAMLVLAIPFVFKSNRSAGLSQSLFVGIMIGLVFFIINRAFSFFVPLFHISPMIGAMIPTALVAMVCIFLLRKIE